MTAPRCLLVLILLLPASPALAQEEIAPVAQELVLQDPALPDSARSLDRRLLHAVYRHGGPTASAVMHTVDWTSTRVFMGAIPAAWVGTWALAEAPHDYRPAYRLTLAGLATTGIVVGVKHAVRRPRPYYAEPGIVSRSETYYPGGKVSYSFPSGHAAMSFAIATSVSLSAPEWYVIVPAVGWATAVSVSRPWLGVHYPSDIAAGAVVGAGVAVLVHALGDAIVPDVLIPEEAEAMRPLVVVPLLRATF